MSISDFLSISIAPREDVTFMWQANASLTGFNISRSQLSPIVKMNSDEFSLRRKALIMITYCSVFLMLKTILNSTHKSGRVVISDCLGITKGLQGRVGLDDLILQGTLKTKCLSYCLLHQVCGEINIAVILFELC